MELYIVSLLHFNLQYCAGGVEGLFPDWPLDNDSIEDQIIVESFVPILDLLDDHPTWGMNLELQAYMIEVLAERHPDALDQLRSLTDSGQVELMSFHYSDQLWTAYEWTSQERSLELVQQVFEQYDMPLSGVVFNQEGQFGPGMLTRMPEFGYDVAVLPRNLARYAWGEVAHAPIYESGDVFVVPTSSVVSPDGSYELSWAFMDDGELLATGGMNPYLGSSFVFNQLAMDEFEAEMEQKEANGGDITTIGAFVRAVSDRGAPELPAIFDGTWQPDSTNNLKLWMGGSGLWGMDEADNEVLTGNVWTSRLLRAAEIVAPGDERIEKGWREALLGQVSDSSGWNPYHTEVAYAFEHASNANDLAQEVLDDHCEGGDSKAVVDLSTGSIEWGARLEYNLVEAQAPSDEAWLPTTDGREASFKWWSDPEDEGALYLDVVWRDRGSSEVSVSFGWDGLTIETIPALIEDEVAVFEITGAAAETIHLPLPSGLAHLSEDLWILKDLSSMHLAAGFSSGANEVVFADETTPYGETVWRFVLFEGSTEEAVARAQALNLTPKVEITCSNDNYDKGCRCSSTGSQKGVWWLGVLPLIGLLRRRS
jgi:hypothetical protein